MSVATRMAEGGSGALAALILVCLTASGSVRAAPNPDEVRALAASAVQDFPPAPSIESPLATLGKLLFFSRSLSGNRDVACASCHHPWLAGGDALSLPVGEGALDPELVGPGRRHAYPSLDPKADGRPNVPRNSPTTFNAGLYRRALFMDGRVTLLGETPQSGIYTPDSLFGQPDPLAGSSLLAAQTRFPVTSFEEMRGFEFEAGGTTWQVRDALVARLRDGKRRDGRGEGAWDAPFAAAFPDDPAITFEKISRALAAYQESQRFTNHAFERFLAGDDSALDQRQLEGARLFFTPREAGGAGCASCHAGPFFTDERYYNLAMPQIGRGKSKRETDFGRELVTRDPRERYAFRTPSLLNVAVTAPYGHDGAYDDLRAVIRHHLDPAAAIERYDPSRVAQFADGTRWQHWRENTRAALHAAERNSPRLLEPLLLPDAAVEALAAFLDALTDPCVQSRECLAAWVPRSEEDPDGWQLRARFAGEPVFKEVSSQVGLTVRHRTPRFDRARLVAVNQHVYMAGGAAAGDLDGDGWDDLVLVGADREGTRTFAFRNDAGKRFRDVSAAWGLVLRGAVNAPALADLDGDGDLDLIVGGVSVASEVNETGVMVEPRASVDTPLRLLRNDGGHFEDVTAASGVSSSGNSFSTSFADIDGDGDLDMFVAGWSHAWRRGGNHLWINQGGLRFTPGDAAYGLEALFSPVDFSFTPAFLDLDRDGRTDLLIAADFLTSRVLLQRAAGHLQDVTDPEVIDDENGMGGVLIDYDGDGDQDWFVTSVFDRSGIRPTFGAWGSSGNRLYRNDAGTFVDATDETGVRDGAWGWGACAGDFDNDGDPDLIEVNGYGDSQAPQWFEQTRHFMHTPARLFVNHAGHFVERAAAAHIDDRDQGRGVVCFDYDRDGDLDVLISNNSGPARLYQNVSEPRGWLQVTLRGKRPNTAAIGAEVEVVVDGVSQHQWVAANSNYVSQNPATLHFGLGTAGRADEVVVHWPGPGGVSRLHGVRGGQRIVIDQPAFGAAPALARE